MPDSQATVIRKAIALELTTDMAMRFEPGLVDEVAQSDTFGCVWIEEYAEEPSNVQIRMHTVGVRIFEKNPGRRREPTRPADPTSLENLAEAAELALKDKANAALGAWFLRVVKVRFNLVVRMAELEIVAWQDNVFTT